MGLVSSTGSHRKARSLFVYALAAVALAFGVGAATGPERAFGHAGEVHSEPSPAVGDGSPRVESGKSGPTEARPAPDRTDSGTERTTGPERETGADSATSRPAEPDTDPTLHFLALGVLFVAGAGLLLVRRRRTLA